MASGDGDLLGGLRLVPPDFVFACRQGGEYTGENRTPIEPAFMDGGVSPLGITIFQADFDFFASQLFPGIDHQRSYFPPDVEHEVFGVNPFDMFLGHLTLAPF
jgi:hypothetical protein